MISTQINTCGNQLMGIVFRVEGTDKKLDRLCNKAQLMSILKRAHSTRNNFKFCVNPLYSVE